MSVYIRENKLVRFLHIHHHRFLYGSISRESRLIVQLKKKSEKTFYANVFINSLFPNFLLLDLQKKN